VGGAENHKQTISPFFFSSICTDQATAKFSSSEECMKGVVLDCLSGDCICVEL
jgi:hypothetical protein